MGNLEGRWNEPNQEPHEDTDLKKGKRGIWIAGATDTIAFYFKYMYTCVHTHIASKSEPAHARQAPF